MNVMQASEFIWNKLVELIIKRQYTVILKGPSIHKYKEKSMIECDQ